MCTARLGSPRRADVKHPLTRRFLRGPGRIRICDTALGGAPVITGLTWAGPSLPDHQADCPPKSAAVRPCPCHLARIWHGPVRSIA